MPRVTLLTKVEPYDLLLEIPESDRGLRGDGVEYWEKVHFLKRGIRAFFPIQLANSRITELQNLANTALQRAELDQADNVNLTSFEERALTDAASVRTAGLKKTLTCQLAIAGIGIVLFAVYVGLSFLQIWNWAGLNAFDIKIAQAVDVVGAIAVGLFGVAFGAATSAFLSSRVSTFETLEKLGRYDLPGFLYVGLLIIVFLLAVIGVWSGFFDIEILNGSASEMFIYPQQAFPLGLICGFAEPAISNRLSSALHSNAAA